MILFKVQEHDSQQYFISSPSISSLFIKFLHEGIFGICTCLIILFFAYLIIVSTNKLH